MKHSFVFDILHPTLSYTYKRGCIIKHIVVHIYLIHGWACYPFSKLGWTSKEFYTSSPYKLNVHCSLSTTFLVAITYIVNFSS